MRTLPGALAIAGTLLCGWTITAHCQTNPSQTGQGQAAQGQTILAQKLVDDLKAEHATVVTAGIHAKKPGSDQWEIIAHTNHTSVGHKSEGADLVTLNTGKPDGPNALADGVFDVGVPLHDSKGRRIGFLAVHIHPAADSKDPKADALKGVMHLRDELAKRIPSQAALFQPAG